MIEIMGIGYRNWGKVKWNLGIEKNICQFFLLFMVFIGILGPKKSGKKSVISYLVENFSYKLFPRDLEEMGREDYLLLENRWEDLWVGIVDDIDEFNSLSRRPFFISLYVDASLKTRYNRNMDMNMDEFMEENIRALNLFCKFSDLSIINEFSSLQSLHSYLKTINFLSNVRPSWDDYFMLLAHLASRRSNCMKRRVGCILTLNNRVLATGYNGTPRGLPNCLDGGCGRCNSGKKAGFNLSECLCLHAEENGNVVVINFSFIGRRKRNTALCNQKFFDPLL
jgi:dCMP deaminase